MAEQDVQALVRFLLDAPDRLDEAAASAEASGRAVAASVPDQSLPPPRVQDRRFDPSPPGAAYPTVWVGDDVTMVVVFAEGPQPRGELVTHFVEDDGHGDMTVSVRAEPVAPWTWRARFALPRAGRWEGHDELDGGVVQGPPPFALRVVRTSG